MVGQVGQERRMIAGWLLLMSVAAFGCSTTTSPTVSNPPRAGFCVYPQACYVLACDCRSGPDACRVLGAGGGAAGDLGAQPQYSDASVDCQGTDRACLLPEQVCVGVGMSCNGECVRANDSCGGVSERFRPQRGDGGVLRCPYPSDICCPLAPPDGGGGDGGAADGGGDGGDLAMSLTS